MEKYRIQLIGQDEEILECREKMQKINKDMADLELKVREEEQELAQEKLRKLELAQSKIISRLE